MTVGGGCAPTGGPLSGVLDGVRVVELASYVAAPTAGRLLGALGAEVIKVEPPDHGDEVRGWQTVGEETSLLWRSLGRNKKSVTIDLRHPQGRELVLQLVARSDVVLEGFRPGTLERLGLGPEVLGGAKPGLVLTRVSGFGQDGPYRDKAGFGSVAEAIGGIRHLTGYPDRPPTRMGVSLGDSLAGVYAVVGTLAALLAKEKDQLSIGSAGSAKPSAARTDGLGELVDVALYEAVYSLLDSVVAEYEVFGRIRQRTGASIPGIAPSNVYPTRDGRSLVIGANGDRVFQRLAEAMGQLELTADPRFADARARGHNAEELDLLVGNWTRQHDQRELADLLDAAGVPAAPVFDAAQISADPHFASRSANDRLEVTLPGGTVISNVAFPAPVPRLRRHPLQTRWVGRELGADTTDVLQRLLGLSVDRVDQLRQLGVV